MTHKLIKDAVAAGMKGNFSEMVRLLCCIKDGIDTLTEAVEGTKQCVVPPPVISSTTVKCCTPTCEAVFVTTKLTTTYVMVTEDPCVLDIAGTVEEVTRKNADGSDFTGEVATLSNNCDFGRVEIEPLPGTICAIVDEKCITGIVKYIRKTYECGGGAPVITVEGFMVPGATDLVADIEETACPTYVKLDSPLCFPALPDDVEYLEIKECPK